MRGRGDGEREGGVDECEKMDCYYPLHNHRIITTTCHCLVAAFSCIESKLYF